MDWPRPRFARSWPDQPAVRESFTERHQVEIWTGRISQNPLSMSTEDLNYFRAAESARFQVSLTVVGVFKGRPPLRSSFAHSTMDFSVMNT